MKKIIFYVKEDLSCTDAILLLKKNQKIVISVSHYSELLSKILSITMVDVSEYWMQFGSEIRVKTLNNNFGIILKIIKNNELFIGSSYKEFKDDEIWYGVYLNEQIKGSYFITKELEDVHDIEHYNGIFNSLGFKTEFSIF